MATRALPDLADFPIPRDVRPGKGWSAQMVELASHIGAYDTLVISEQRGGDRIYIPIDADRNPLREIIGPAKARIVSRVYGRETLAIPTARYAIEAARRAPIVAAARAKTLTLADAARVLGVRRDYMSRLVNRTDEAAGATPLPRRGKVDPRQLDMFGPQPAE